MSRGVLAIFGDINQSTVQTLTDLSDYYHIPYITWSRTMFIPNSNKELKKKRFLR